MGSRPDLSIITVVYNDPRLGRAIQSVRAQDFKGSIEHIIVDGGSTDSTCEVIANNRDYIDILIQEPDNGIYDAMNKGLRVAQGEVIAILNADDQYSTPSVISLAMQPFRQGGQATYGDIVIERPDGSVLRSWKSGKCSPNAWRLGWMPPHPSVFLHRSVYEQFGYFRTDLPIAADYEFMLRAIYLGGLQPIYVPQVAIKMASGGASQQSLSGLLRNWNESRKAWQLNGSWWGPIAATVKPLRKLSQLR